MALALFDLDNTLLNGDSDHAWGMYVAETGAVDAKQQKLQQDLFYQQYLDGELDIIEYCEYQFEVLAQNSLEQLHSWRSDYIERIIKPMVESGKPELVEQHRQRGDTLVIITATNDFVTRPIADLFGVEHLIAVTAEMKGERYTGKVEGVPSYQQGKVTRLQSWIGEHNASLDGSVFYSDSHNDLPLLEVVDTPVAVTPDDTLRAHAEKLGWKIID